MEYHTTSMSLNKKDKETLDEIQEKDNTLTIIKIFRIGLDFAKKRLKRIDKFLQEENKNDPACRKI